MIEIARSPLKKSTKAKKIGKKAKPVRVDAPAPIAKKVAVKKAGSKKRPVRAAIPSPPAPVYVPAPPVTGIMRTESRRSAKATKLKPSLRDDMPVPAFGFIDVCFCLDATGSMCGEIAAAQSVIEHIIHNI